MNVLIIYDLSDSSRKSEVKKILKLKGYRDSWKGTTGNTIYLPESTVWKSDIDLDTSIADLRSAVNQINQELQLNIPITILRCVSLPATPWRAIRGTAME